MTMVSQKFTRTQRSSMLREAAKISDLVRNVAQEDAHPEALANILVKAQARLTRLREMVAAFGKIEQVCGHCGRGTCAVGEPCPVCGDIPECVEL
jgi:hypothetical protein